MDHKKIIIIALFCFQTMLHSIVDPREIRFTQVYEAKDGSGVILKTNVEINSQKTLVTHGRITMDSTPNSVVFKDTKGRKIFEIQRPTGDIILSHKKSDPANTITFFMPYIQPRRR